MNQPTQIDPKLGGNIRNQPTQIDLKLGRNIRNPSTQIDSKLGGNIKFFKFHLWKTYFRELGFQGASRPSSISILYCDSIGAHFLFL